MVMLTARQRPFRVVHIYIGIKYLFIHPLRIMTGVMMSILVS